MDPQATVVGGGNGVARKSKKQPEQPQAVAGNGKLYTVRDGVDERTSTEFTIDLACSHKSPLLMDMFEQHAMIAALQRRDRQPARVQEALEVLAAEKIYRDNDGYPVMPFTSWFAMLRDAGYKIQVGGKTNKITSAGKTNLPAILDGIEVDGVEDPEHIRLVFPEGTDPLSTLPCRGGERQNDPKSPWCIDVRQGRNNNNGGTATCIIRPRFDTWGFRMRMRVNLTGMESITLNHLYKLVEIAGRNMGFGAFRPSTSGPFGRFKIDMFEVISGSR
jgi:hypothetical protein